MKERTHENKAAKEPVAYGIRALLFKRGLAETIDYFCTISVFTSLALD